MAKTKKKGSASNLTRRLVDLPDVAAIVEDARRSSDRTAAIVLASWLEQVLEQVIVGKFSRKDAATIKNMQDRGGALSSFFGKIYLGYALGLYEEDILSNLEIIRKIRNAFAHAAVAITFDTPEIAAEGARLNYAGDVTPGLARNHVANTGEIHIMLPFVCRANPA
jgi:hypothetical protein